MSRAGGRGAGVWRRARLRGWVALIGLAAALLAADSALAVDGVLEINARCASAGCFPGDDPGYPVQITERGSYRLTGNLHLNSRGINAIRISSEQVTLDLNGFNVGYCLSGLVCGIGTATGISANRNGVTVRNGSIRGSGGWGIWIGRGGHAEDLHLSHNSGGLQAEAGSRVTNITSEENINSGVHLGSGAIMSHSVVRNNDGNGVSMDFSCLIVDSVIARNDGGIVSNGFNVTEKGGYRGTLIYGNDGSNEVQPISGNLRNLGGNICGSDTICP